mmetsp:Transcript_57857/g.126832  ORF Transcript_57857/g.126832 Transcript_57857/m.126832 type:complete len:211 (-) Transcript_57857:970-1602(-)
MTTAWWRPWTAVWPLWMPGWGGRGRRIWSRRLRSRGRSCCSPPQGFRVASCPSCSLAALIPTTLTLKVCCPSLRLQCERGMCEPGRCLCPAYRTKSLPARASSTLLSAWPRCLVTRRRNWAHAGRRRRRRWCRVASRGAKGPTCWCCSCSRHRPRPRVLLSRGWVSHWSGGPFPSPCIPWLRGWWWKWWRRRDPLRWTFLCHQVTRCSEI